MNRILYLKYKLKETYIDCNNSRLSSNPVLVCSSLQENVETLHLCPHMQDPSQFAKPQVQLQQLMYVSCYREHL